MRETAERALDGTAVIQTKSEVSDGGGGWTTSWTAAGTVPCRLAPFNSGAGEQVAAERLSPDSTVIFTFPAETNVGHEAQVVYLGGTFSVTAVRQRSQEITRRIEAKPVE